MDEKKLKRILVIALLFLMAEGIKATLTYTHNCESEGHSMAWSDYQAPTCIEDGYYEYQCIYCGQEKKEIIEALGHEEGEWIVVHAATCVKDGYSQKNCTRCNAILGYEELAATRHIYGSDMVCKKCGFDWTICKGNHKNIEMVVDEKPTCWCEGYGHLECIDCGDPAGMEGSISKLPHEETESILEPGCTMQGLRTIYCKNCNEILRTEVLNPYGHQVSGWIIEHEASCNHVGRKHKKCLRCGMELASAEIPMLEHTTKVIVLEEPTHAHDGRGIEYCTSCNSYLDYVGVEAEPHNYSNYVCTICGHSLWKNGWTAGLVYRDGQLMSLGRYKNSNITIVVPEYTPDGVELATLDTYKASKLKGANYSKVTLILPDTVTNMASGCLMGSKFKLIEFGTSVKGFSYKAFYNGSFNIRYRGTLAQWNEIRIAQEVFYNYNGYIYCTDATIYYKNGKLMWTKVQG